ncbi:unnamed protein product [Moneuplotes crassus]|uniref:Uncharacterized protein n=1 Tax=Euplotes crassus TaxID=5936 RepID=A0AAD2D616_EUPCR|nr:unnamed protein product [Moneuplotes crassus]
MESILPRSDSRVSRTLFTNLGITNEILPFYGYADQCSQLMSQLRSQSRHLWKDMDNIQKWFKHLAQVKRVIRVDDARIYQYLNQNRRYSMFKIELWFRKTADFKMFDEFLSNSEDGSICKANLIEITKVYLPSLSGVVAEEFITIFLERINKPELVSEMKQENWGTTKVLKIPSLFQFPTLTYSSDQNGVYVLDSRITEIPSQFISKGKRHESLEFQCKTVYNIHLGEQYIDKLKNVHTFTKDQNRNLKEVLLSVGRDASVQITESSLEEIIVNVNKKMPGADLIRVDTETICFLPINLLNLLKQFNSKVIIDTEKIKESIKVKTASLNVIEDDKVQHVVFKDCAFNIGKETEMVLLDDGFVYVNIVDQFYGELVKEETKGPDLDLMDIIDEYMPSGMFSPYPPDLVTSYGIVFNVKDLQKVLINDPVILKNITDKELLNNLCIERIEKILKEYESWPILPPPNGPNTQIIQKTCSVEIDIGTSLMVKDLSIFFDLLTKDYSYLKIDSISSFYYMEKERAHALNNLFKSSSASEGPISNQRYINKLNLKVAFEEDLLELLQVLSKYPVLDITITYDGEVTEALISNTKAFMVKYFNRTITLHCEDQTLTQVKHLATDLKEESLWNDLADEY